MTSFKEAVKERYLQASSEDLVVVEFLLSTKKILAFAADNVGSKTTRRLEDALKFQNRSDAEAAKSLFEKAWKDTSSEFQVRTVAEVTPRPTKEQWLNPPGINYFHQPK